MTESLSLADGVVKCNVAAASAEFTANSKVRILGRQDGRCAECGRKLGVCGEKIEYHHRLAVWEGGTNDPENGVALCAVPYHANLTGQQAGERAEARRHQKKAAGIRRQPKGRGFRGWRKFDGTTVWRE